jgi:DNA-binding GntR family transcriptional regulator
MTDHASQDTLTTPVKRKRQRRGAPRPTTQKEQIYLQLRRALQEGRFEPGDPVSVKTLEDELGAGTMPVRESVQRLVAEGALVHLPTGRIRVPQFTAQEYDEIKDIRIRLEGLAVNRAATRMTAERLSIITAAYRALLEAAHKDSAGSEAIHLNFRFHFSIYEASGSKHLISLIDSLWLRVSPLLSIPFKTPLRAREGWLTIQDDNQDRLLRALADRDDRAAESVMREIIQASAAWYHRHHTFATEEDSAD